MCSTIGSLKEYVSQYSSLLYNRERQHENSQHQLMPLGVEGGKQSTIMSAISAWLGSEPQRGALLCTG